MDGVNHDNKKNNKKKQINKAFKIFHHNITIPFHTTNIFSFLSKLFSLVPKKSPSFLLSLSIQIKNVRSQNRSKIPKTIFFFLQILTGVCREHDQCTCYANWQGNDCKRKIITLQFSGLFSSIFYIVYLRKFFFIANNYFFYFF